MSFNRISSLILSVLLYFFFWAATWGTSDNSLNLYVFVVGLALIILGSLAINYKRVGLTWPQLLLPCLYLVATACLFVIITNPTWRNLYLIAACLLFYNLESKLGRESHFLQNIYLFSVFAIYLGLFGLQFYLHISILWMLPVMFALTYLFIVQGFAGFSLQAKKYFSLIISLVCTEAALGLLLWPTYYVVDAVVVFCIFYLLWIFSFSAFFGKLTRNKVYLQLTLVGLVLFATLVTASFRPLIK